METHGNTTSLTGCTLAVIAFACMAIGAIGWLLFLRPEPSAFPVSNDGVDARVAITADTAPLVASGPDVDDGWGWVDEGDWPAIGFWIDGVEVAQAVFEDGKLVVTGKGWDDEAGIIQRPTVGLSEDGEAWSVELLIGEYEEQRPRGGS